MTGAGTPTMDLGHNAEAERFRKIASRLHVEFARTEQTIETLEGPVACRAGDAIVTGSVGERWPVPGAVFDSKYVAVPPTRSGESGWYRTLPVGVLAVRLRKPVELALTDGRGSLSGEAGDWLVQYAPGDCGIVRDDIFRATYEPAP